MQITKLLQRLEGGDRDVIHVVIPLVYDELKKLAKSHLRREIRAIPLETTALVHEAFLKLAGSRHPSYENRAHFFGIASRLMRQILWIRPEPRPRKSAARRKKSRWPKFPTGHLRRTGSYWPWTTRCTNWNEWTL